MIHIPYMILWGCFFLYRWMTLQRYSRFFWLCSLLHHGWESDVAAEIALVQEWFSDLAGWG